MSTAPSDSSVTPYLHGFSRTEQERLIRQARLAESTVFHDIDMDGVRRLLEVGCGVGAQTEILLRRFPQLHVTGVDLSVSQLNAALANLGQRPWLEGRYTLQQSDATDLSVRPVGVADIVNHRVYPK